jgi:glycosyltransferase involved in cell wall biosynthesis
MSDSEKRVEIFALTEFLYSRAGLDSIVLITNRPRLVIGQLPDGIKIYVVCRRSNISVYQKILAPNFPHAIFINFHDLSEDFVQDKLLLCFGNSSVYNLPFLRRGRKLAHLLDSSALSVIGTSAHLAATRGPLSSYPGGKSELSGKCRMFTESSAKNQSISLRGRLVNAGPMKAPLVSVLAIIHVYNEHDIIRATVRHLLDQGVDVHVIDNWSNDGTYEVIEKMAASQPRITYERFPTINNNKFELEKMLVRVTDVAKIKRQYDWVFLNDADEIRWSPWKGLTLREAFSFVDKTGYNAVDFTVFNFVPTEEGFDESQDPITFFRYGEFGRLSGFFSQIKAWKNHPEATLAPSGGHHISFPGLKIFPLKFLLGHYPIRSTKHGLDKIFKQRMPRYATIERQRGWHVQYDDVDQETTFLRPVSELIKFNRDSFYRNYLVERISGIGIKRDTE